MENKPPLSPAAQAILDACGTPTADNPLQIATRGISATALRAVVSELAYINDYGEHLIDADKLLTIANELENQ